MLHTKLFVFELVVNVLFCALSIIISCELLSEADIPTLVQLLIIPAVFATFGKLAHTVSHIFYQKELNEHISSR